MSKSASPHPTRIGFLLFPGLMQLDFAGPYGVLAAGPDVEIHLISKDGRPVLSSEGLLLTPGTGFAGCPDLDVLCLPGGAGVIPLFDDLETHAFLRAKAENCRYLCSVCTGSLVLGAAGLLRGYRATTHWLSKDILPLFEAKPQPERVVRDGNRITAAGVCAGIDMALLLAGLLWGDDAARAIQLKLEYAPEPPYSAGSPESAPPETVQALRSDMAELQAARRQAALEAAARHGFAPPSAGRD